MDDPSGDLNDPALKEEIELLGELMAAVTQAGHQLCESEIDRALHGDVADPSPEQAHRPVETPEGYIGLESR